MFNPLRTIARHMLASMFVVGGIDALRNAGEKVPVADDVVDPLSRGVPQLQDADTEDLVRLSGAVQVVGGLALALGKAPRVASAALAATLVPTTLAAHRFWEQDDPAAKANHQVHFFKNVAMMGGLLLGVLDTEGRPGMAWRTKHAAEHAALHGSHAKEKAQLRARETTAKAKKAAAGAAAVGALAGQRAKLAARHQADTAGTRAELVKKKLTPDVVDAKRLVSAARD